MNGEARLIIIDMARIIADRSSTEGDIDEAIETIRAALVSERVCTCEANHA